MKIRIKAKDVEIEYEQQSDATSHFLQSGASERSRASFLESIKMLIDGVEQLLKAV